MLNSEKLDTFLDAFLDNRDSYGRERAADADFWDRGETDTERMSSQGTEEAGHTDKSHTGAKRLGSNGEATGAARARAKRSSMSGRKRNSMSGHDIFTFIFLVAAVPVTIWAGLRFFGDRKYLMISIAIAVYSIIPFFVTFEGRKPQARELLTIAVLIAIAVAGRAAFFMTPNFKPVAAVTIITGVSFGAESGFMVGSLSMLASNMLFGQGPWTPWQMCAMGLIGFVAGLLFGKGRLREKKAPLCVFGFFSVLLIYGGIVNIASLTMFFHDITPLSVLMIYMSGLPMDLVHAVSTVIFLWLAARPMLEKLERIKVKYGMLRAGSDRESND